MSVRSNLSSVVICFEFIIFALSITAKEKWSPSPKALWFASNLLFLHYQSQLFLFLAVRFRRCDLLRIYYFCTINHSKEIDNAWSDAVVICFEFIIFALSITAYLRYVDQKKCCDLLRIYYFCTINHSKFRACINQAFVVICFEFIIFALSITAKPDDSARLHRLWFASNLLFLHYQSQRANLLKSQQYSTPEFQTGGARF